MPKSQTSEVKFDVTNLLYAYYFEGDVGGRLKQTKLCQSYLVNAVESGDRAKIEDAVVRLINLSSRFLDAAEKEKWDLAQRNRDEVEAVRARSEEIAVSLVVKKVDEAHAFNEELRANNKELLDTLKTVQEFNESLVARYVVEESEADLWKHDGDADAALAEKIESVKAALCSKFDAFKSPRELLNPSAN